MANVTRPYLFCVYAHLDELLAALAALKKAGQNDYQVYSPIPHHDIEHALGRKPSPVRVFTLIGGLIGLAIGWGITIGPISNYNLHVGGKPLLSIPPFGVVAYICTILFGALATVLGLIVNTRLPQFNLVTGYDERLSSDHFGVQVYCPQEQADSITKLMKDSGAIAMQRVGMN
jgi:hypothetical protein